MMLPDPFTAGIILVLVGVVWWIWIGARARKAHVLEVIAIIALFLFGVGIYFGTALITIIHGGH